MVGISLIVAWLAWRFVEWPALAASRRLAARIGTT
jgi:peptidoglycan/LPS O-acetylase OafA/YrhL